MAKQTTIWKKGRGKLGFLQPLIGTWKAVSETQMGKMKCTREFRPILAQNYIQLIAKWDMGNKVYEENAIIGIKNSLICFWSFTNDGKNSEGYIADGTDVHPKAICFEAQMPAGLARMVYWPNEIGGFNWAVESKIKKGWNRFVIHHYSAL